MPQIDAPREKKCSYCIHYGFKRGNPRGYRWAYCFKRNSWFRNDVEKPGDYKCEEWE